jgi:hypothetical protein
MTSHSPGKTPTEKKAKFTVSDAARAFRQARGDAEKVERIEGEKRYIRRDETGRFVIVGKGKSSPAKRKAGKTRASAARERMKK